MGSMIQAKCECGFDSGTIVAGGGFMNFRSMGMEPALCQHCKRLVMRDYKTKSSRCPECHKKVTFYNDLKLQRPNEKQRRKSNVYEWEEFVLPDGEYLCPKCGRMAMRFKVVGHWD